MGICRRLSGGVRIGRGGAGVGWRCTADSPVEGSPVTALGFVVLAVAGTLLRAATAQRFNTPAWPWGTLGVNVLGSFALGLLVGADNPVLTAVGAGGLGSLTTLSTLAVELTSLGRTRAIAYAAASLTLGLAAATAGLIISG
ncbi:MAG: fluoride efflux transporter CrcB [Acidimicrobiia bacterium]|nr:fluoride efflux transporter CrcB [Acidimicrobiia bacterium]MYG57071.1 fluoride efflux transporter CrcB [Acidimicrobiia bacterium]MYJ31513.1 fluoride efflux transporter CrcB [Acidimicrobiia bacterium]